MIAQTEPVQPVGDEFSELVPEALDPAVVRRLSELRPAISTARIVFEWMSILGTAWLCSTIWSRVNSVWIEALAYVWAVMFIGARQHGLLVLAHDAAHYRLFKNRSWNDWFGELVLTWPFLLITIRGYRRSHFPHHRHLNTERDPDWVRKRTPEWVFPKTKAEMARMLLAYATGIGFLRFIAVARKIPKQSAEKTSREDVLFSRARLVFIISLFAILTFFHAWQPFLLFWVVPFVTWMQLCFQIRSVAEHFAIQDRAGVFAQTRTVITTWFDRLFLVPNHAPYHLEHHLYPSVPFYRLPELHRILMEQPVYRSSAHVTRGYLNMLRECVQRDDAPR